MISIIRSMFRIVWLKICHPSVRTNGIHSIKYGTEINVKHGGTLVVGKNVATQKLVTLSVIGGCLSIGDRSIFNRNDIIVCHDSITIGDDCAFGPNVVIYDHDHKFGANGYSKTEYNTAPIIIEDKCWIGSNVTILRGTHIGTGCVVGAGCIIKGDFPPHTLIKSKNHYDISAISER